MAEDLARIMLGARGSGGAQAPPARAADQKMIPKSAKGIIEISAPKLIKSSLDPSGVSGRRMYGFVPCFVLGKFLDYLGQVG